MVREFLDIVTLKETNQLKKKQKKTPAKKSNVLPTFINITMNADIKKIYQKNNRNGMEKH